MPPCCNLVKAAAAASQAGPASWNTPNWPLPVNVAGLVQWHSAFAAGGAAVVGTGPRRPSTSSTMSRISCSLTAVDIRNLRLGVKDFFAQHIHRIDDADDD